MDINLFKKAMGSFATGVCVITAKYNNQDVGITINSLTSVSLEPPLILWCIDHNSTRYDIFSNLKKFNVNILSDKQQEISNRFAFSKDYPFNDFSTSHTTNDIAFFEDNICTLECTLYNRMVAGDHEILIAQVKNIILNKQTKPLLYFKGSYSFLSA
jgi:flavin reductase (DIM6/NTAB) family NADH-FMN oxidoreductase RutF